MTLPTLTWAKRTTTASVSSAPMTTAEFINQLDTFVSGSTYWRTSNKFIDVPLDRGWIELAPVSTTPGVTEIRILITYDHKTLATPLNAANVMAPCTNSTSAKTWVGVSPNAANTMGVDRDPFYNQAYLQSAWPGMVPWGAPTTAVIPVNGLQIGMIESAEVLALYYYSATDTMSVFIAGNWFESPDGNSSLCGLMAAVSPWNRRAQTSTDSMGPIAGAQGNYQAGSTTTSLSFTIGNDGTIMSASRNISGFLNNGNGYANGTDAILQGIALNGSLWGNTDGSSRTLDIFRGFARQMRWGPPAFNLQRLINSSAGTEAILLNYPQSSAAQGGIWFDNSR